MKTGRIPDKYDDIASKFLSWGNIGNILGINMGDDGEFIFLIHITIEQLASEFRNVADEQRDTDADIALGLSETPDNGQHYDELEIITAKIQAERIAKAIKDGIA